MRIRILIILFSGCLFSMSYPVLSLSDEEIRQIEKTTWRIEIETHISDIYPEAIQYAVFDSDPVVLYKKAFLRAPAVRTTKFTDEDYFASVTIAWDMLFLKISAADLALLPASMAPASSDKDGEVFNISSNAPEGGMWVVTKVTSTRNGQFRVWAVPVSVKTGSAIRIRLDDDNAIDLLKLAGSIKKSMRGEFPGKGQLFMSARIRQI
jgi:hypothetical protein